MNKWYRGRGIKGFWLVTGHLAAVFLVVCMALVSSISNNFYIGSLNDWKELSNQEYEESRGFSDQARYASDHILQYLVTKENLETEGVYDPDKIVDIKAYYAAGDIIGKDSSGFSYTLGDLYNWSGGTLGTDEYEKNGYYSDETSGNVVVCKRSDDTYHYYTMSEFKKLITDGKLVFKGEDVYTTDILNSLEDGYDTSYYTNQGTTIQNAETGETEYTEFWVINEVVEEKYLPVSSASILEIANENPDWNGKLTDMYEMLISTINNIRSAVQSYQNGMGEYAEGNTNMAYLLIDNKDKKVYTNRKAYSSFDKAQESIKSMKAMGKYVVVMPKLEGFETNMQTSANEWTQLSYMMSDVEWSEESSYVSAESSINVFEKLAGSDYIYVVAVDTAFPIEDEFYESNTSYHTYAPYFKPMFVLAIFSVLVILIAFVWLTVTAGRVAGDDELHLYAFDEIWTEVGLIASCFLLVPGYLSIVRRIKAKNLWKRSIIRKFFGAIGLVWNNWKDIWKVVVCTIGLFVIHWITYGSGGAGLMILIMLLSEMAAFIWVVRHIMAKEAIQKGIEEVANGNVTYQIPLMGLKGDNLKMAEAVNNIGDGLQNAVEKSMKDERLKTDLITNVSHDIKTPLTSIINYVDLLKREQFDDPKIQGYIDILESKAQRLKQLTEDVVEASKVSSGNVTLECMDINLVEMIQQIDGEFIDKLEARKLTVVKDMPEEAVVIHVDGRRMSRILENIYGNACKYALEGTRVYADLKKENGNAVFSLKNISEQPLNISADELTERFIRGDVSRTTEGSGLGLSIAKSLTTLQGGDFQLYLDGDLFRVTITFPLVK